MSIVLKNNASDFLAAAIDSSQTTITLESAASFPTLSAGEYFYGTIESTEGTREIVRVNARVGNTFTVVRGQDGTAAASFAQGSRFESRINVASVEDKIQEIRDDLAADDGSSLVGFTRTGSAVPRTVQDRLREWVSVLDFGADPTGATDSTSAIQAALNTRRNVFIPGGSYTVSATLNPHKGQIIQGEGNIQRSLLNESLISRLNFPADTTAFDTVPNIALGCSINNIAILAADQTNGSGAIGVKVGTKGTQGGASQGIKCSFRDVYVRGFDIGFGNYGWAWEITYHRCFADRCRTSGWEFDDASTIVTCTDCSVLLQGFAFNTAPALLGSVGYRVLSGRVYFHSPRAENCLDSGWRLSSGACVTIDNIYAEGNRRVDIALTDSFSGELVVNNGLFVHDNSNVNTFACIENKSTNKCSIIITGCRYSLGSVNTNTTSSGFYYSENTAPYAVIEGLVIGRDVAKMSSGNKQVVYLSQAGRYAPARFTVTDFKNVTFYALGTSHIAKIEGSLPTTLLISDGTTTYDMLTNGSLADVGGRNYRWSSARNAWALITPRSFGRVDRKNSDDSISRWWGDFQGVDIVRFAGQSSTTTIVVDTTDASIGATFFVRTRSGAETPSTITVNDQNGNLIGTVAPSFVGPGSIVAFFAYHDIVGVGVAFQRLYTFLED